MPLAPRPVEERFWPKVDRRGPDECWPWRGAHFESGCGKIGVGGRRGREVPATQISWSIANGRPWPEGKKACHTCDNPPCVNPAHIWPGTQAENLADMRAKGRGSRPPVGVRRGQGKLNPDAVPAIRAEYTGEGRNLLHLAARFDVARQTILDVINGRNWSHVS